MKLIVTLDISIKYHYAECRYAECHYAECRGAINTLGLPLLSSKRAIVNLIVNIKTIT